MITGWPEGTFLCTGFYSTIYCPEKAVEAKNKKILDFVARKRAIFGGEHG
jgi:hypothetical protein